MKELVCCAFASSLEVPLHPQVSTRLGHPRQGDNRQ